MKWNNILVFIAAIFLSQSSAAQNTGKGSDKPVTITGKVLSKDQKSVKGAVFYIDNSKTRFESNSNGSYKIKVSPSARILSVRSSEYGFCDTLINGQTTINFILPGSSGQQKDKLFESESEEKVNTVNGITNQSNTKSAVNKIDGRKSRYASYADVYQMLNGAVPGVRVEGTKITIRGPSSMTSTTPPLFVVDGVIVYTIDDIKPLEVESIEVLKTSSAGKYGYLGSNGVIVITTNRVPGNK